TGTRSVCRGASKYNRRPGLRQRSPRPSAGARPPGRWRATIAAARPCRPNAGSVAKLDVDFSLERLSLGIACGIALQALEALRLRGRRGVGAVVRDEDVLPAVKGVVPGERFIVEHI